MRHALVTGGTGSVVRPIVPCKGSVCVHGLADTQAFADRIYNEFYLGWHSVKLPHKFKIGIGGVKPGLHDFGIVGQSVPDYDEDSCNACKKCAVVAKCPVHAATQDEDGNLVIDWEKCTNCGKCIGACPFDSIEEKERGFAVYIGGIWGKTQRLGTPIGGIYSEDEVMKLIEKALLLYREQGQTGERFGRSIDRIGVENFIAQLKSDDVLSRKDQASVGEVLEAHPAKQGLGSVVGLMELALRHGIPGSGTESLKWTGLDGRERSATVNQLFFVKDKIDELTRIY